MKTDRWGNGLVHLRVQSLARCGSFLRGKLEHRSQNVSYIKCSPLDGERKYEVTIVIRNDATRNLSPQITKISPSIP